MVSKQWQNLLKREQILRSGYFRRDVMVLYTRSQGWKTFCGGHILLTEKSLSWRDI